MIDLETRLSRIAARARMHSIPDEALDALLAYLTARIEADEMTAQWRQAFALGAPGAGLSCLCEEFSDAHADFDAIEQRAIELAAKYPDVFLTNLMFSLPADRAWERIGPALVASGVSVEILLEHCFARASAWSESSAAPSPLGRLVRSYVPTHFAWMRAFLKAPHSTLASLSIGWERETAQLARSLFDLLLTDSPPDLDRAEALARDASEAYRVTYLAPLLRADRARFLPWATELVRSDARVQHAGLLDVLSEIAPMLADELARALIERAPWESGVEPSQYTFALARVARVDPSRALEKAETLALRNASPESLDLLASLHRERYESALLSLLASESPMRAAFALERLFATDSSRRDDAARLAITHDSKVVRDVAKGFLVICGEPMVLSLAALLEHAHLDARLTLVELFGASGGARGRELLREHLATERSSRVRKAMLSAAGTEGEPPVGDETPSSLLHAAEAMQKHLSRAAVAWFEPENAPPLQWADGSAAPSVVGGYLLHCQSSAKGLELDARVAPMVHALDPASRSEWAAALLKAWEKEGCEARFTWCLVLAAAMDASATTAFLADAIEQWAIKRRAMAVQGVQVLAMLGTDDAMHFLSRMTDTHAGTLGAVADAALVAEAGAREMSRDELADAVVPRFQFDAKRLWRPSYGKRGFEVEVADDFLLNVHDERGRSLSALPKPGAKDDPARAGVAFAAWKTLRAEFAGVVERELSRMERALIDGRTWQADRWLANVVAHPILGVLASRLVWRCEDGRTLRAQHGAIVDAEGREITISNNEIMGLLHPVEVDVEVCQQWIASFTRSLTIAPFDQCTREVFMVTEAEREQVTQRSVRGRAMRAGPSTRKGIVPLWVREGFVPMPTVNGLCPGFERRYPREGTLAVMEVSGIGLWRDEWEDTVLLELRFTTLDAAPRAMTLGEVHPRVYSEAMRAVHRMSVPKA